MTMMTSTSRMILRAALAAGLMASVGPSIAVSPSPDDPSGTWVTEDNSARIRVERCGVKHEQICGFIVWMKQPVAANGQLITDQQNPDPTKRSRPILGQQLLMGLTQSSDGRFEGRVYNAETGKTYEISLWREGAERVNIKGCMLSILCGTRSWTRTTDVVPGQLVGMTGEPHGPSADKEWARAIQAKPPGTAKTTQSTTGAASAR
jgi:uncharacterized protein (DUF2147 family)